MNLSRGLLLLVISINLINAVPKEDKFPVKPVKSIYNSNEPGSASLPDELQASSLARDIENPPQRPTKQYMNSKESNEVMPNVLPEAPFVLSGKEKEEFEERIRQLEITLDQEVAIQDQVAMGSFIYRPPQSISFTLSISLETLPENSFLENIFKETIADVSNIDIGSISIFSDRPNQSFTFLIIPLGIDFDYETGATTIAHRIDIALKSGVFIRLVNFKGLPIKLSQLHLSQPIQIQEIVYWRVTTEMEVSGVDSHRLIVPFQKVFSNFSHIEELKVNIMNGNDTYTLYHFEYVLKNNSAINVTAEEVFDEVLDSCRSLDLETLLSEASGENITIQIYCALPFSVSQEPKQIATTNSGMGIPCYGHGTLLENKTCDCNDQWKDHDCGMRRCPIGFLAGGGYLPGLECSGQGKCEDQFAVCVCDDGYENYDCSTVLKCSPTVVNGEKVPQCSGHGSCIATDEYPHQNYSCKCLDGWLGDQCQTKSILPSTCPIGFGKVNNVFGFYVCSGRGECHCANSQCQCDCSAGWDGVSCALKSCPSKCSGHGDCYDGECICAKGWAGDACDVTASCINNCHSRGECVNGECVCRNHFAGSQCEIDNCELGNSDRRVITVITEPGFHPELVSWHIDSESRRDQFEFNKTDVYNLCLENGQHSLTAYTFSRGWRGGRFGIGYGESGLLSTSHIDTTNKLPSLNQPIIQMSAFLMNRTRVFNFTVESSCPGEPICSGHGKCIHGTCCCDGGWEGESCSSLMTTLPTLTTCAYCKSYENCSDRGSCECTRVMAAAGICSSSSCPTSDDFCGVCSGHGDCVNGACVCDVTVKRYSDQTLFTGWFGDSCSQVINCPNSCNQKNGRGHCDLSVGKCVCESNFYGDACEFGTCEANCNGHGVCQMNGTCLCDVDWEGEICQSKRCAGGCASGVCVDGACECAEGWFGVRCEEHITCARETQFSNCSRGCMRTCESPSCETSRNKICTAGCECPSSKPLWDSKQHRCVAYTECSGECWNSLFPNPHEIAVSVQPTLGSRDGVAHVCAHKHFQLCYRSGEGLLSNQGPDNLIYQARQYHAPIGVMIYDAHNNPIREDWAKFRIESDGTVVSAYKADLGSISMSVHNFGNMEIRFFVIGPSSTAPVFLARQKIFASDCDRVEQVTIPVKPCKLPTTLEHGKVECDGAVAGAVCKFTCDVGFMLSAPQHQHMICEADGKFETEFPTCIDSFTTQSCEKRDGEVCQSMSIKGEQFTGFCLHDRCVMRDSETFCAHPPPSPSNEDCSGCVYECNHAFTVCHLKCPETISVSSVAQCGFGPGGWWSGVFSESCQSVEN